MSQPSTSPQRLGLLFAILSAATFGTSGTFATSLIDAGWTAGAAVTARICLAALILTVPALVQLRRQWPVLRAAGPDVWRRSAGLVGVYGVIAVAGCQLCYFNAVERLSVGVALLLEYLAVLLVVGWLWLRHQQRPRRLTVVGSAGSLVGLALVLDLTGHEHLDPIGVMWGLLGAVGCAVYYVLSARADEALPPIVMAWAAMVVGAVTLFVLGALGAVSMHASFGDVTFAAHRTSWVVPVVGLALLSAALAYVFGIAAARLLGPKLASFLGMTEVLFAVFFAWAFLGQLPAAIQLAGGALIILGVTLVRVDEFRAPQPLPALEVSPSPVAISSAGSRPPTSSGR
jgi:drug/metabolite transporter (DMT)-like permease